MYGDTVQAMAVCSTTSSVIVIKVTTDLDQQTTVIHHALETKRRFVAVMWHSASTQVHVYRAPAMQALY